ncbi:hypothetical protein LCGC14_0911310, partial [marine sediment metagenome]
MSAAEDAYKTLAKPSKEVLFKERKSKFFGYAFPITVETDVKLTIEKLKGMHAGANHFCYAWQIGVEQPTYRVNDDGEPNNSAGMPIYGQIQAYEVTNVLVVVVRIFGGTKLGVGGLIGAYKTAAQMALETSKIVNRTLKELFIINFAYPEMNKVMRTIKKRSLHIVSQKMQLDCEILISVRKRDAENVRKV